MKNILWKIRTFALVAAFSFGMATMALAQDWGDYSYDEQQWWNPADWYDSTTDAWDYNYSWNDYDWNDYGEGIGYGGDEDDYGYGYGSSADDDFGYDAWYEDFDYGL